MKIKPILLFFISGIIVQQVWAQTPEIERLLKTAEKANGKEKIIALADVCKNFYSIDPHKGIEIGKEALHLADSLEIPSVKSKAYNCIGVNYWALSDYPTARLFYDSALKNATQYKDTFEIGIFYNRMGLMYESLGYFDSSLLVFNKELAIYRQLQNSERIGNALENIGTIHLNRGEFKSALRYLIEAISVLEKAGISKKLPYIYMKSGQIYSELQDFKVAEQSFQKGIEQSLALKNLNIAGIGYNALGILYKNQGRYEEAIKKFETALEITKGMNNRNLTQIIYGNMGNTFHSLNRIQDALNYHQKSLDLALQMNMPLFIAQQQVNLGQDYHYLKDYDKARSLYEKALPAFIKIKAQSDLIQTYMALIEVNDSLKNFEKSVHYYQLYNELKDSLNKHELNTALDSLRVKFHTEQTDRENEVLKHEAELQDKTITLQRIIMFSSFAVLVLVVSLVVVAHRSRQKIKNANELLEIKNIDISSKAEELRTINEKLVELSKFKDSMNSFLVHDLKNPLNAIINFDPKQYSEHQYETVKHVGKQMLNIVMNLLDISKYENKTMKISLENTSVTQLINDSFLDVQYAAEQKSIRLMLNYQTDFVVKADPEMIERVFVNLFSNAIR
ncbi:MAG: tetratricopeptide repeat-containing sensor histidine kinase, partial [Bacteroidota bacterium]